MSSFSRNRLDMFNEGGIYKNHLEPCMACGYPLVEGTTGHVFCINEHPGLIEGNISQPLSSLEILNTLTFQERRALGTDRIEAFRKLHQKRCSERGGK